MAACSPRTKQFITLTFPFAPKPNPHHHRGFYDRQKLFWKEIEDLTMVVACSPRIKHFLILTFPFSPHHRRGFYDRKKLFWKEIEDLTMVAACGPPGGGRQEVTPRLLRHFTMLCMPAPSEAAMRHIFGGILGGFLTTFFPPGEGVRR